jgi:hypothetical protein
MAIDPNIAMGIRPIEQPNMLAQMGQMMQLRQLQQEYEGSNALRDFYAQGGDINKAEDRQRLLSRAPMQGQKILGQESERRARDVGTIEKRQAFFINQIKSATTPEHIAQITQAMYGDPDVGPMLKGIRPLSDSLAAIPNDPKGLEDFRRRMTLGADNLFESANAQLSSRTSLATNAATVGVARDRLNMDREKNAYERANPALNLATGDNGFYLYNARDPNSAVPLGMRPQAPVAPPVAQPSAVNNLMMTTQPSVNSLIPTAPNQPGAPTVANAAALAAQPTLIRPSKPIRQPVAVIKDGVVTLVPPEQAVGMTPATPGAEKALEKTAIAKEGKQAVNGVLNTLYSEYNSLVKSGGITDTRLSTEENIAARTGASGLGQLTGSYTGSESQSFRDTIEQTRPLLLTAIMKATGLSATQLNSNVELQTYLKTATDPKVSIQSNVKALNNISTMFGIGEKFEVPEIKGSTPKEVKPSDAPPAGLSPEIAKLWQYMTPEDRKLWQK